MLIFIDWTPSFEFDTKTLELCVSFGCICRFVSQDKKEEKKLSEQYNLAYNENKEMLFEHLFCDNFLTTILYLHDVFIIS